MASYLLHVRMDSARLQQRADVARIAGQYHVVRGDEEGYMRVDDVGRTGRPSE